VGRFSGLVCDCDSWIHLQPGIHPTNFEVVQKTQAARKSILAASAPNAEAKALPVSQSECIPSSQLLNASLIVTFTELMSNGNGVAECPREVTGS